MGQSNLPLPRFLLTQSIQSTSNAFSAPAKPRYSAGIDRTIEDVLRNPANGDNCESTLSYQLNKLGSVGKSNASYTLQDVIHTLLYALRPDDNGSVKQPENGDLANIASLIRAALLHNDKHFSHLKRQKPRQQINGELVDFHMRMEILDFLRGEFAAHVKQEQESEQRTQVRITDQLNQCNAIFDEIQSLLEKRKRSSDEKNQSLTQWQRTLDQAGRSGLYALSFGIASVVGFLLATMPLMLLPPVITTITATVAFSIVTATLLTGISLALTGVSCFFAYRFFADHQIANEKLLDVAKADKQQQTALNNAISTNAHASKASRGAANTSLSSMTTTTEAESSQAGESAETAEPKVINGERDSLAQLLVRPIPGSLFKCDVTDPGVAGIREMPTRGSLNSPQSKAPGVIQSMMSGGKR